MTCLICVVSIKTTDCYRNGGDYSIDNIPVFPEFVELDLFKIRLIVRCLRQGWSKEWFIIETFTFSKYIHVDFIMSNVAVGLNNLEKVKPLCYIHENCQLKEKVGGNRSESNFKTIVHRFASYFTLIIINYLNDVCQLT